MLPLPGVLNNGRLASTFLNPLLLTLVVNCLIYGSPKQTLFLDSTPSILDSGYWIQDSLQSGFLGVRIPIVNGILDSLS